MPPGNADLFRRLKGCQCLFGMLIAFEVTAKPHNDFAADIGHKGFAAGHDDSPLNAEFFQYQVIRVAQ